MMTKVVGMVYGVATACLLIAGPGCGSLEISLRALGLVPPPIDPAETHPILPFDISPADPGVAYERFMAFGDMGTGREDQSAVAGWMVSRVSGEQLDFILTLGDNIYENGVSSESDPLWESNFEQPYGDPALDVPIYPTLGNHDHRGDPDAQIEYSNRNPSWMMPARYYTLTRTLDDGTQVQFFAIDTTPLHDLSGDASVQIAWLTQALADSEARWKIVFGHHPLYSHGPRGADRGLIDTLGGIFTEHDVDVYFAGHEHTLEMLKPVDGVHYVISGAAGGVDKAYSVRWTEDAFYAATLGGFTYMRISRDELVIEFVRAGGRTQYAHTLRK